MGEWICATCRKCGSNVGSRNDQVVEITTTTVPVTITAGTVISRIRDVPLSETLHSKKICVCSNMRIAKIVQVRQNVDSGTF